MSDKMQQYERMADIAKTIAHPLRMSIVLLLCQHKELTVSELTEALGEKQTAISQHLNRMKLQGCLKAKRKGKFICYYLINPHISEVINAIKKWRSKQLREQ